MALQDLLWADPEIKPPLSRASFSLSLQESWGRVEESWPSVIASDAKQSMPEIASAASQPRNDNGITIFLIQDAHVNESAQRNIAKILDQLVAKEKVQTIFLEAGTGDDSLSDLRPLAPPQKRRDVSARFLQKGWIQGPDYLDLNSERTFQLWGVEDKELYFRGIGLYGAVRKDRERANAFLDKIRRALRTLKPRIFHPSLSEFDDQRAAYLKGDLLLSEYFKVLSDRAHDKHISLLSYPNFLTLQDVSEKESRIDFHKANAEQQRAVAALSTEERSEFLKLSRVRADNMKELCDAYAALKEKLLEKDHPELFKYFDYLQAVQRIRHEVLLDELGRIEKRVYEALTSTADEKTLLEISHAEEVLRHLVNLQATSADIRELRENPALFDSVEIGGYLNRQFMELESHYEDVIFLDEKYDVVFKSALEFYGLTEQRDEVFVKNIVDELARRKQDKAAFVAGGFHTENLKKLLRERNISYVSILPRVLQETNITKYETLLLSQIPSPSLPSPLMAVKPSTKLSNTMPAAQMMQTVDGTRLSVKEILRSDLSEHVIPKRERAETTGARLAWWKSSPLDDESKAHIFNAADWLVEILFPEMPFGFRSSLKHSLTARAVPLTAWNVINHEAFPSGERNSLKLALVISVAGALLSIFVFQSVIPKMGMGIAYAALWTWTTIRTRRKILHTLDILSKHIEKNGTLGLVHRDLDEFFVRQDMENKTVFKAVAVHEMVHLLRKNGLIKIDIPTATAFGALYVGSLAASNSAYLTGVELFRRFSSPEQRWMWIGAEYLGSMKGPNWRAMFYNAGETPEYEWTYSLGKTLAGMAHALSLRTGNPADAPLYLAGIARGNDPVTVERNILKRSRRRSGSRLAGIFTVGNPLHSKIAESLAVVTLLSDALITFALRPYMYANYPGVLPVLLGSFPDFLVPLSYTLFYIAKPETVTFQTIKKSGITGKLFDFVNTFPVLLLLKRLGYEGEERNKRVVLYLSLYIPLIFAVWELLPREVKPAPLGDWTIFKVGHTYDPNDLKAFAIATGALLSFNRVGSLPQTVKMVGSDVYRLITGKRNAGARMAAGYPGIDRRRYETAEIIPLLARIQEASTRLFVWSEGEILRARFEPIEYLEDGSVKTISSANFFSFESKKNSLQVIADRLLTIAADQITSITVTSVGVLSNVPPTAEPGARLGESDVLPVVDADGHPTGRTIRREERFYLGSREYVHSAAVFFLRRNGRRIEMLTQNRAADVSGRPDFWDATAAGRRDYGETIEETAARELKEESAGRLILPAAALKPLSARNLILQVARGRVNTRLSFFIHWVTTEEEAVIREMESAWIPTEEVHGWKWRAVSDLNREIREDRKKGPLENRFTHAMYHGIDAVNLELSGARLADADNAHAKTVQALTLEDLLAVTEDGRTTVLKRSIGASAVLYILYTPEHDYMLIKREGAAASLNVDRYAKPHGPLSSQVLGKSFVRTANALEYDLLFLGLEEKVKKVSSAPIPTPAAPAATASPDAGPELPGISRGEKRRLDNAVSQIAANLALREFGRFGKILRAVHNSLDRDRLSVYFNEEVERVLFSAMNGNIKGARGEYIELSRELQERVSHPLVDLMGIVLRRANGQLRSSSESHQILSYIEQSQVHGARMAASPARLVFERLSWRSSLTDKGRLKIFDHFWWGEKASFSVKQDGSWTWEMDGGAILRWSSSEDSLQWHRPGAGTIEIRDVPKDPLADIRSRRALLGTSWISIKLRDDIFQKLAESFQKAELEGYSPTGNIGYRIAPVSGGRLASSRRLEDGTVEMYDSNGVLVKAELQTSKGPVIALRANTPSRAGGGFAFALWENGTRLDEPQKGGEYRVRESAGLRWHEFRNNDIFGDILQIERAYLTTAAQERGGVGRALVLWVALRALHDGLLFGVNLTYHPKLASLMLRALSDEGLVIVPHGFPDTPLPRRMNRSQLFSYISANPVKLPVGMSIHGKPTGSIAKQETEAASPKAGARLAHSALVDVIDVVSSDPFVPGTEIGVLVGQATHLGHIRSLYRYFEDLDYVPTNKGRVYRAVVTGVRAQRVFFRFIDRNGELDRPGNRPLDLETLGKWKGMPSRVWVIEEETPDRFASAKTALKKKKKDGDPNSMQEHLKKRDEHILRWAASHYPERFQTATLAADPELRILTIGKSAKSDYVTGKSSIFDAINMSLQRSAKRKDLRIIDGVTPTTYEFTEQGKTKAGARLAAIEITVGEIRSRKMSFQLEDVREILVGDNWYDIAQPSDVLKHIAGKPSNLKVTVFVEGAILPTAIQRREAANKLWSEFKLTINEYRALEQYLIHQNRRARAAQVLSRRRSEDEMERILRKADELLGRPGARLADEEADSERIIRNRISLTRENLMSARNAWNEAERASSARADALRSQAAGLMENARIFFKRIPKKQRPAWMELEVRELSVLIPARRGYIRKKKAESPYGTPRNSPKYVVQEEPYEGNIVPVVTPLLNGAVDPRSIERLVDLLERRGVKEILVMGHTGEFDRLENEARLAAIRFFAEASRGRLEVHANLTGNYPKQTLSNIEKVSKLNINIKSVVVAPLYYLRWEAPRSLVSHVREIRKITSKPIVLYNNPWITGGQNIDPADVAALRSDIFALKDSSGDLELLKKYAESVDVYAGDQKLIPQVIEMRRSILALRGAVASLGNISRLPQEIFFETDPAKTAEMSARIIRSSDITTHSGAVSAIAGLKYILKKNKVIASDEVAGGTPLLTTGHREWIDGRLGARLADLVGNENVWLDDNVRLKIPTRWVGVFSQQEVYMLSLPRQKSISLMTKAAWEKRLEDHVAKGGDTETRKTLFLASSELVPVDKQGRLTPPTQFREKLWLRGTMRLKIVGAGDHLQIWAPEMWKDFTEKNGARMAKTWPWKAFLSTDERTERLMVWIASRYEMRPFTISDLIDDPLEIGAYKLLTEKGSRYSEFYHLLAVAEDKGYIEKNSSGVSYRYRLKRKWFEKSGIPVPEDGVAGNPGARLALDWRPKFRSLLAGIAAAGLLAISTAHAMPIRDMGVVTVEKRGQVVTGQVPGHGVERVDLKEKPVSSGARLSMQDVLLQLKDKTDAASQWLDRAPIETEELLVLEVDSAQVTNASEEAQLAMIADFKKLQNHSDARNVLFTLYGKALPGSEEVFAKEIPARFEKAKRARLGLPKNFQPGIANIVAQELGPNDATDFAVLGRLAIHEALLKDYRSIPDNLLNVHSTLAQHPLFSSDLAPVLAGSESARNTLEFVMLKPMLSNLLSGARLAGLRRRMAEQSA